MIPFYTLIRSKRRTLSLQIDTMGELIVRSPLRTPLFVIEDFIMKKTSWIEKSRKKIKERYAHQKTYSSIEKKSMKKILRTYIEKRVEELWKNTSLPEYTSIKITLAEKRWWSCSGKNWLCFSYRLAEYLAEKKQFIDAIIVHELAHLKEKNHQKPFWNLVYSMMPEYEKVLKYMPISHSE